MSRITIKKRRTKIEFGGDIQSWIDALAHVCSGITEKIEDIPPGYFEAGDENAYTLVRAKIEEIEKILGHIERFTDKNGVPDWMISTYGRW